MFAMATQVLSDPEALTLLLAILSFGEGALIGLERERSRIESHIGERERVELPGIRTFGLLSLLGSLTSSITLGPLSLASPLMNALALSSIVFVIILTVMFMYHRMFRESVRGITTYVVMFIAFIIGFITGMRQVTVALGITFLTTGVLAMKDFTRKAVEKISYEELVGGLELGIIVFIVGPIALSTNYKIYGISVKGAYIFFTLILAISYTSYLLYRLKGTESLKLISFLGGLVNSEATLVNVAKLSPSPQDAIRLSAIVNAGLMLRSCFLLLAGAYPFLGMEKYILVTRDITLGLAVGFAIMILLFAKFTHTKESSEAKQGSNVIKSPLEFKTAARGAMIYVILLVTSKTVNSILGQNALLPLSFIGGLASAGAAIFSLLTLAPTVSYKVLAAGALLAIAGGLVNKPFYAKASTEDRRVIKAVILTSIVPALAIVCYAMLIVYVLH